MLILRAAAGLLGFYLIYLTFVMRESIEGNWVNRIEELWIRIDDRNKAVGETTKTLFEVLARKVNAVFDRIVGTRLVSIRLIGISGSLSFTSCFLIFGLFFEIAAYFILVNSAALERISALTSSLVHHAPLLILAGIVFLFVAGLCLILAILPMLLKSPAWEWLSCLPTAFWLILTIRLVCFYPGSEKQLGIVVALAISLASNLLLLALIRSSLKWVLVNTTIWRMVFAVAMQLVTFVFAFVMPAMLPVVWRPDISKSKLGADIFLLAVFNFPTAIASMMFGISLLVVLLHRFSWPLLSKLTYVLTRNEVLDKRRVVRMVGGGLILFDWIRTKASADPVFSG